MSSYVFTEQHNFQTVLWAVAVVAFLPVELWVGLAIGGVFGFVTFPRKQVRK